MSGPDADATPSWAVERAGRAKAPPRPPAGDVPATLFIAVGLTVVETAVEVAHVVARDELTSGLRVFLVLIIAMKLPLARAALHLSSGAAMGLLLFEATALLAAAGGAFGGATRLALAATALAVIALLAASLHAFPSPQLPPISGGQE